MSQGDMFDKEEIKPKQAAVVHAKDDAPVTIVKPKEDVFFGDVAAADPQTEHP